MLKDISYIEDKNMNYKLWCDAYEVFFVDKYSYFKRMCRGDDEIIQSAFEHTLYHFDAKKGELVKYATSLISKMSHSYNKHEISCDFIEVATNDDTYGNTGTTLVNKALMHSSKTSIPTEVENRLGIKDECFNEISKLALLDMNYFVLLCNALINKDSTTSYYPDQFRRTFLKIYSKYKPELAESTCIEIYKTYQRQFKDFLLSPPSSRTAWHELDYGNMEKNTSRRIKLVDIEGNDVANPDKEDWYVSGRLYDKKIYKIPYTQQMKELEGYLTEDMSPFKFTIGENYICRSFAGSLSALNVNIYAQSEVFKYEAVTNFILDTQGRFLAMGDECIYMLVKDNTIRSIPQREINGITLSFDMIDVTPSCRYYIAR